MEFLSAGVFTEELRSGESAILGVSTSNFGTVGWFPRGEEDKATLVTSLADYFRKFGGYWKNSVAPLAVTAFFKNDGARAYIVRVTPSDAVAAQVSTPGSEWLIKAISKGTWGNLVRVKLSGNANYYDHATGVYSKFDVEMQEETSDGAGDFSTVEVFEAVDLTDEESPDYFPTAINDEVNGSGEIRVTEVSGGIPVAFIPIPVSNETIGSGTGFQQLFTGSLAQSPVGPFSFNLKVNGTLVATDDGRGHLRIQAGVSGFTAISGYVTYGTGAYGIQFTPAVPGGQSISADYVKKGADSVTYDLVGGVDGTAVTRSQMTDPALEASFKGLYALSEIDEILNIGLADFRGDPIVQGDLIAYCENRQDCFAILDIPQGSDAIDAKNYKQVTLGSLSDYAAIYWPGIKVPDPLVNGKLKIISPVGHVAGVIARTDATRNVAKAPAGVIDGRLNFASALEYNTKKGDRDVVYPVNINPLRADAQVGRAVWGARTLAVAGDFTLVGDRRLFIFLRKSTFNATHDLVFEPIGGALFATVKLRMDSFMNNLTQQGYFASRIPAEAFRVICDTSNNTTDSIKARQLICDVLVATQTPAEFVRFRFQRSLTPLA